MFISEKSKIKANVEQRKYLSSRFGEVRYVYNHLVELVNNKAIYPSIQKDKLLTYVKQFVSKESFLNVSHIDSYLKAANNFNVAYNKAKNENKRLKFKSKRLKNSFYVSGENLSIVHYQGIKKEYIKIKGFEMPFKIFMRLRYTNSKIIGAYFSFDGFDYYVSLVLTINKSDYVKTHLSHFSKTKSGVGIDVGTLNNFTLSCGVVINLHEQLKKYLLKVKKMSRNLSRKVHPRTKDDQTKKSKNFIKYSQKLHKLHIKIKNIRKNFCEQFTSFLLKFFNYICIEDLKISKMLEKHSLAKKLSQLSFYEFRNILKRKVEACGKYLLIADKYFPSSKTCCKCGSLNKHLTVFKRMFKCKHCGFALDRDLNAAANLFFLLKKSVGVNGAELKSMDLAKLFETAKKQNLIISKVEVETCKQKTQELANIFSGKIT